MRKSAALLLALVFLTASCIAIAKSISVSYPGSWTSKAPMQVARSGLGVAAVNGKIYAIGGDGRSGKWPYVGSFVGTNEEYDPETDTWVFKAPMPTPRCDFAIAAYQNKIYCIGGITGVDDESWPVTGVNEVYDTETDTWETKAPVPTARWALQANVVNGKIYLIGGYVPDDSDFGGSMSVLNEVYDPETDSWTTKAPMPIATSEYPSAVVDNKIYVIGGLPSSSNLNQIYDAETDMWSQGASSPSSTRNGAAGATTGVNALKRIYVLGETWDLWEDEPSYTVRVYDPASDRWTFGANIPTNRLNFRVAVVNDVLYAIGGFTRTYPELYTVGDFITLYATNEQYTPLNYGKPDPSYVPPDSTAPEIAVLSPENKTYYSTNVTLAFAVNEPTSRMSYCLDGANVTVAGNTTLAGLSYSVHNLTVYAVDVAGNTGASETISFSVEVPFPVVPVAAASAATIAVVGVGLLVYFKKRKH